METLDRIGLFGLLPLIESNDKRLAVLAARAFDEAGLGCAEVALRTPTALDALAAIRMELPAFVLGAGTVLTPAQVDRAAREGADFVVSPGLDRAVVERALALGLPVVPGVGTPTEIMAAMSLGLAVLKFFPAEASGGVRFISAMSGPFPTIRFIPTGGLSQDNVQSYIAQPGVLACGGAWMATAERIQAGDRDGIARRAALALDLVKQVRAPDVARGGRENAAP